MLAHPFGVLLPGAGVLVLQLHPRRPGHVLPGEGTDPRGLDHLGDGIALPAEPLHFPGAGAVTRAGRNQRPDAPRMLHGEVQSGEAPHGDPDDVRVGDGVSVQYGDGVVDGVLLGIRSGIGGDLRRGIAPGAVGDAAVAPREPPHLRLPGAMVAGELVDEEDRIAAPHRLGVQRHAVGSRNHLRRHL